MYKINLNINGENIKHGIDGVTLDIENWKLIMLTYPLDIHKWKTPTKWVH